MIPVDVQEKGKFLDNIYDEILWNKLCIYNMPLKKHRKLNKTDLILNLIMIIDPITGLFEITQYNDIKDITIENLVETVCLYRYPWTK